MKLSQHLILKDYVGEVCGYSRDASVGLLLYRQIKELTCKVSRMFGMDVDYALSKIISDLGAPRMVAMQISGVRERIDTFLERMFSGFNDSSLGEEVKFARRITVFWRDFILGVYVFLLMASTRVGKIYYAFLCGIYMVLSAVVLLVTDSFIPSLMLSLGIVLVFDFIIHVLSVG